MQNNIFIGNLAKAAILIGSKDRAIGKFTLISNEYAGKDKTSGEARERAVSIQFTAFRKTGATIAQYARKGDQLIVTYRIENNYYKDKATGEDVYGYNFIVDEFSFGAAGKIKRDSFSQGQGDQAQ